MTKYESVIQRGKARWGRKFRVADINKSFIPYFNSGDRVEVRFRDGEVKRGRVGITTGWKPAFLLMLTTRSTGSSYLIGKGDKVLQVISR